MLRHISAVLLAALTGSIVSTSIWTVFEGGTGGADPVRMFAAFVVMALLYTIPGAVLLMAVTFALADRGLKQSQASVLLVIVGTLAGAMVLGLFSSLYFAVLGGIYGCLTAVAFVTAISAFRAYPVPPR